MRIIIIKRIVYVMEEESDNERVGKREKEKDKLKQSQCHYNLSTETF